MLQAFGSAAGKKLATHSLLGRFYSESANKVNDAIQAVAPSKWASRIKKAGIAASILGVASGGGLIAASQATDMPVDLVVQHAVRFARTAWFGISVAVDYKYSFRGLERGTEPYQEMRKIVDARVAKKLLALCQTNRGIYVKAGQHLASLTHAIPREYGETLSVLQDKAEHRPFNEVVKVFRSEFGKSPDEIYDDFQREPVAAASLAQVHFAKLKETGESVAVKVQYPNMQEMFIGDIKTIEIMLNVLGKIFPHFQYSWILPDFTDALTQELDFINEGKNGVRAKRLFSHDNRVYIPKVYWNWTTKRVLTMEFCHGVKVNDINGIKAMHLDPNDVAKVVLDNFSEQIYLHGFIHSDPHPGNILVRPNNKGKPEMVLLDHGLYKEMSPKIRIAYCQLWKALVLRRRADVEKYGQELGAGQFTNLLALVLTFRTLDNTDVGLGQNMTKEDMANIRKLFSGGFEEGLKNINELLENLPRELLFVLRTTNLIRSINKDLGANTNRFVVMASYAVQGINLDSSHTSAEGSSLMNRVLYWVDYAHFKLLLKMFELWRFVVPVLRFFQRREIPDLAPAIVDTAMKRV